MIEDLYLNPFYWTGVCGLVALAAVVTRSAFLGFRFVIFVFLSQFFVHSFFVFGVRSTITWFTAASWILFLLLSLPIAMAPARRAMGQALGRVLPGPDDVARGDATWFWAARLFLVVFWAFHLVVFPFSLSSLDLGSRLAQQQDNKLFFFIGQLTLPVIAACMAMWLRRGYRFTWLDVVVGTLTVVGLLGGGSKATLLPLVLAFFGAAEMAGRRLREFKRLLLGVVVLGCLAVGRLLLYFPGQSPLQTASLMLYRIAANTDSLEYLKVSGAAPSDYPAAGPLALIPYISKRFGYDYPYPPGVWLFGERYGNYTGQGPNSGFVLDFFGNLGWAGLILVALLALAMTLLRISRSTVAIGAASVIYLALVDVTLFDVPFLVGVPATVLLVVFVRMAGRSESTRALTRFAHVLDRPVRKIDADPRMGGSRRHRAPDSTIGPSRWSARRARRERSA